VVKMKLLFPQQYGGITSIAHFSHISENTKERKRRYRIHGRGKEECQRNDVNKEKSLGHAGHEIDNNRNLPLQAF